MRHLLDFLLMAAVIGAVIAAVTVPVSVFARDTGTEKPVAACGTEAGELVWWAVSGSFTDLHSFGLFSSYQAAYNRLAELGLLNQPWFIQPHYLDQPLTTIQAAWTPLTP